MKNVLECCYKYMQIFNEYKFVTKMYLFSWCFAKIRISREQFFSDNFDGLFDVRAVLSELVHFNVDVAFVYHVMLVFVGNVKCISTRRRPYHFQPPIRIMFISGLHLVIIDEKLYSMS